MNCFPCFSSQRGKKEGSKREHHGPFDEIIQPTVPENIQASSNQAENGNTAAQTFNFRELAAATKNFRQECLLGEGGFGRVYKGTLQATGQLVAVKQLDRAAMKGNKEFLMEVGQLSLLQHPNLVNLVGYCADGDQRLLVYEFMPSGSVEDHLLDMKAGGKPLDWITRMKIAYGTAQGLEYLHEKANPPVIYRDLKSSNVLLDEQFNPKLSDIGLGKLGPSSDQMPMQSRMMGTYGYSAPEYSRSGQLTIMADVYSFGVVLLELITGRRAIDTTKPVNEQNLVDWAQPIFREPKQFPEMADPLLKKRFPERGLNQAVAMAAMCLQDEAAARPLMSDLVTALSFLSIATEENSIPPTLPPSISSKLHCISTKLQFLDSGDAGKLKKQETSVHEADTHSELDHDHNDKESVSSSSSSSVDAHDESALTHVHSRSSTDGSASPREESACFNQKSNATSPVSLGHASSLEESSRDAHDLSDSLSQKSIKNSQFSSTQNYNKESEDASVSSGHEDSGKSAVSSSQKSRRKSTENETYSSSSDSPDESVSSRHEKSSREMLDESSHASQKGSRESTNGSTVSASHESSLKSQDGDDSVGHNSSRKLTDGKVSASRKISRKKYKDGSASSHHRNSSRKPPDGSVSLSRKNSRKPQQGNHNSSSRASHDESNSPGSSRKGRRRSKKVTNDSLSRSSSTGESQDEKRRTP